MITNNMPTITAKNSSKPNRRLGQPDQLMENFLLGDVRFTEEKRSALWPQAEGDFFS